MASFMFIISLFTRSPSALLLPYSATRLPEVKSTNYLTQKPSTQGGFKTLNNPIYSITQLVCLDVSVVTIVFLGSLVSLDSWIWMSANQVTCKISHTLATYLLLVTHPLFQAPHITTFAYAR